MKALEKTVEKLNADLVKNATATKAAGRAAGTATGNIQRMGIAFRTTLGPIVALYGAFNFLNSSLKVASQRQVNLAKLTNGLKNLGGTEGDLRKLTAAADEFGRATLFDQEDATEAFALLTSFQRIGVDSYERVTKAAADLATVTGQDLKGAMTQLSKALEDPARRVTDLARSGTVFTEQQKAQIKALQESGRLFEAQALILKEIEKQYGGAAEAAGSAGLAGALDTLGEATRDFQQELVTNTTLVGLAEAAIYGLAEAIDGATFALKQWDKIIIQVNTALKEITTTAGLAGETFGALGDAFKWAADNLAALLLRSDGMDDFLALGQDRFKKGALANLPADYKAQEQALAAAAAGFSPAGRGGGSGGGGGGTKSGGKSAADAAAREAEKMADQLLKAEKLVTAAERRLDVLQTTDEAQKAIVESENKMFEIAEKYGELAAKSMSDAETENLLKAQGLEIQAERVALEEQLADIEKQRFSGIDEEIAHMEAILAGTEEEYLLRKKIAELGGGPQAEAKALRAQELEAEVEAYRELESQVEQVAGSIASSMTNAFTSVIDGSKSAEEALADMFKDIGKSFIDMAMQIIQQQIQMIIYGMIMKALGIGGGAFGSGASAPSIGTSTNYFGSGFTPMNFFADGGRPKVGEPSIVGERGPELFVPDNPGRVISNEQSQSAMEYFSPMNQQMAANGPMNSTINYNGPTLNFNGDDYIPRSEASSLVNAGAKQGEQRAMNRLRQSRSTRSKVGI